MTRLINRIPYNAEIRVRVDNECVTAAFDDEGCAVAGIIRRENIIAGLKGKKQ